MNFNLGLTYLFLVHRKVSYKFEIKINLVLILVEMDIRLRDTD